MINKYVDSIKSEFNRSHIKDNENLVEYKLPEVTLGEINGYDYGSYSSNYGSYSSSDGYYLTNNYYTVIKIADTKTLIRKVYNIEIKNEDYCNTTLGTKMNEVHIEVNDFRYNESGIIPSDSEILNHNKDCNLQSRFYTFSYIYYCL